MRVRVDTAARACVGLALAAVGVALCATLAYSFLSVGGRPWDNVEGCILFEASRLRDGFPLYIDPVRGAFEYGPVPARYYVLYPPVFAWLLSHLSATAAPTAARVLGACAWFGLLARVAAHADDKARRIAWIGAAFIGGVYSLALFGASGRPDGLAVALAGLGLARSSRLGRVDPLSAALFAFAPWVKPNVVGLAVGALMVDIGARRARAIGAVACAAAVTLLAAVTLQRASGGAWVTHLVRSTGQGGSWAQWLDQVPSRLQFLGVPLAVAATCGWGGRKDPRVAVALGALGSSLAWTLLCSAKIGSATNYWMEPCVASLVVLSRAPSWPIVAGSRARLAAAIVALVQSLWTGVASVRSVLEELAWQLPSERHALERAREVCRASRAELLLGDEVGIELALNGRIMTTPFQMTHLARRGLFPVSLWLADVRRPELAGVVMEDDLLERPLTEVDVNHDRYGPELRAVLRDRFALADRQGEWRTYCRRSR